MAPPESVYDDHADWYAGVVRRRGLIHLQIIPEIMAFIGDVSGQRLLDIACGEGIFTRELASRSALVTGVDLSTRLLAIAANTPRDGHLRYVHDDARTLSGFPDSAFHGATCIMALMDIDDIGATFQSVHRVTRRDAWFVVVVTYPCFESPHARTEMVGGESSHITTQYLTEEPWRGTETGVRSRFGAQHRTLATYLNTAIDAGWNFQRMIEPRVVLADNDETELEHPGLLIMKFHRR